MSQFPSRPVDAPSGSQFISSLDKKDSPNRDEIISNEILKGNFPNFLRQLAPITINQNGHVLIYYVMPDYLAVGSDTDYVRAPLGAEAAQKIADAFGMMLPTAKMSDEIWQQAKAKLKPEPMSAGPAMSDTDYFAKHNQFIQRQLSDYKPGDLVAGHKKDVIISNNLEGKNNNVAIHGMHDQNGKPIQGGTYTGHNLNYRDYSHGIRLIDKEAILDGKPVPLASVLQNPELAGLVSSEGAMQTLSYNQKSKQERPATNGTGGRLSLLDRLTDYIDKINKTI